MTLVRHWNGTSWTQVASPGGALFGVSVLSPCDGWAVGGSACTRVGQTTLVRHWNGTSWMQVASPNPGAKDRFLSSVSAVSATDAWAVGAYETSTGILRTLILRWNGTSWTQVASPDGELFGVSAMSAADAWAVGIYQNSGTHATRLTLALHWDGSIWTRVPCPSPGTASPGSYLSSVSAVSPSDAWAVGVTSPAGPRRPSCCVGTVPPGRDRDDGP
jgi:hypothetical protein